MHGNDKAIHEKTSNEIGTHWLTRGRRIVSLFFLDVHLSTISINKSISNKIPMKNAGHGP